MLDFLIKRFIKTDDFENPKNRNNLIKLTGYMGLIFNILLFIIKVIIGLAINSISVISDAANNLTDSFASVVAIVGTYLSEKPADKDHPFGHGRVEYLASLSIGVSIIVIGIILLKSSIENIINPRIIKFSWPMMIILVASISIKLYMYIYNMKVYRKVDSQLSLSQAVDSKNDVIMSAVVVLAVIITALFNIQIEGPIGVAVSIIILKSGYDILRETGVLLLGTDVDKKTFERLKEIILSGEYIIGLHDIEIHDYGKNKLYGTVHVEVPVNIDVYSMHEVVDSIEKQVKEELYIDLSIHMDPSYCLEEDHFQPAPCRILNEEERKKRLEKNKEKRFYLFEKGGEVDERT